MPGSISSNNYQYYYLYWYFIYFIWLFKYIFIWFFIWSKNLIFYRVFSMMMQKSPKHPGPSPNPKNLNFSFFFDFLYDFYMYQKTLFFIGFSAWWCKNPYFLYDFWHRKLKVGTFESARKYWAHFGNDFGTSGRRFWTIWEWNEK